MNENTFVFKISAYNKLCLSPDSIVLHKTLIVISHIKHKKRQDNEGSSIFNLFVISTYIETLAVLKNCR
jgi:hypothetical protein